MIFLIVTNRMSDAQLKDINFTDFITLGTLTILFFLLLFSWFAWELYRAPDIDDEQFENDDTNGNT